MELSTSESYTPEPIGAAKYPLRTLSEIRDRVLAQKGSQTHMQYGGGGYKYIVVLKESNVANKKFSLRSRIFTFRFKKQPENLSYDNFINLAFREVLHFARENLGPEDLMGIKINVFTENGVNPVGISFTKPNEISSEMLTDLIFSVAQSNDRFSVTSDLEISVTSITPSKGGSRVTINLKSEKAILKQKKRKIIDPGPCPDFLCLPKCLILGKKFIDGTNVNAINRLLYNEGLLAEKAKALMKLAGVTITENVGCSILDIYKFQNVLKDYCIYIYNNKKKPNQIFCRTQTSGKRINLFYFKDLKHFIVIKDRRTFFGIQNMCEICDLIFNTNKHEHKCLLKCPFCTCKTLCIGGTKTHCNDCNRDFISMDCFRNHKTLKIQSRNLCESVCLSIYSCSVCGTRVDMSTRRGNPHTCNEFYCKLCLKYVESDHLCYIKKYERKIPDKFNIIFFDLESTQDTIRNSRKKIREFTHVPNLCVSESICNVCLADPTKIFSCTVGEGEQRVFSTETCVKKFIDYLDEFEDQKVVCIAHNLSGYDGMFILNEISNREFIPEPIMVGWKIYRVKFKNITFLDSLLFMPMPLSKIPEAFDLGPVEKGYYPYLFNTKSNLEYSGVLPPKEMYGIDNFLPSALEKFEKWYDQKVSQNFVFNNYQELVKYCKNDVEILRKGCIKFIDIFLEKLGINPFLEATTLASAVMLGFRKNHLTADTLGIVPAGGYNKQKKQSSKLGNKWLEYENRECGNKIIPEFKIPGTPFYVDGYNPDTNEIYEMMGCYYHGHTCIKFRPLCRYGQSLDDKYESTMLRLEKLRSLGYTIVVKWECEANEFFNNNPELNASLEKSVRDKAPINIRDAIFGGVVDVYRTYYAVKPNEKIMYFDFTSVYPWIGKTKPMPIGHPRIYDKTECENLDITGMHGFIKCKILPPQNLFHMILPVKMHSRMIMPACRTCAEKQTFPCNHSDESDRALYGTWVLAEVNYAILHGYRMLEIYQVLEYNVSEYDPVTKTGGVFTSYMNQFVQIKEQSDGFKGELTLEEKLKHIADFYEHEGIHLDLPLIIKCPPLRQLAKLCLNTLWGKTIQNNLKTISVVFNEAQDLFDLMSTKGLTIADVIPYGKESVWVKYNFDSEEYAEPLKHQSLPIGGFTTAYGRIHLHEQVLSKLESGGLDTILSIYADTDSIVLIVKPDSDLNLPIGKYLGELTNELVDDFGPNAYITQFTAIGAKSYSYIVYNPDKNEFTEISKCKGISKTVKSMEKLTFEGFKHLVDKHALNRESTLVQEPCIEFDIPRKIKRTKDFNACSVNHKKKIKFTVSKRYCLKNSNLTVPFGYLSLE